MNKKHGLIQVISGKNQGKLALIKYDTCKLIGRSIDENDFQADDTYVMDRTLDLDLEEKKMSKINAFLNPKKKIKNTKQIQNPYRRTTDFILDDQELSRAHAMIFFGEDIAGLVDLASTNGTYINGKTIDCTTLHGGEIIVLGKTEIKFSFIEEE